MSRTDGRWTAKTSFPDLQLFISGPSFVDLAGNAGFNTPSAVTAELGAAGPYAILAYSGITNVGNSVITGGNFGSVPTDTITGFPPGVVVAPGFNDQTNATAAQVALAAAIVYYQGLVPTLSGLADLSTGGNGATAATYLPGNYFGGALAMPTGIILDAQGNPNAQFVFVASSTINLATGQAVTLVNGAQAANVVFVAGTSLTTVGTSVMVGTLLAAVSITLGGGTLYGRALANTGAVTISAQTTLTVPKSFSAIPGLVPIIVPVGSSSFFVVPQALLLRSGVFATPAYDQEQFGTALDQPGPSMVALTNGPDGSMTSNAPNYQGFPPFPQLSMATLGNIERGPQPKGMQIDSIKVIYQFNTDATNASASVGITRTDFANLVAPVVTNIIPAGNNGLLTAVSTQPRDIQVLVPTPGMIVAKDTEVAIALNFTAGAAGTVSFYGIVLYCHYNFA